jgi:hypothetical protein
MDAYGHEICLHNARDKPITINQTTMLFNCLMNAKQYLETVISFSEEDLQGWSGIDWARFRYIVTLATKLTFALDSPLWNTQSVRETLKLENYLDAFSSKLRQQITQLNASNENDNWYSFFLRQLEHAKQRYLAGLSKWGIEPSPHSDLDWQNANVLPVDTAQDMYALADTYEDIDYMSREWFSPLELDNWAERY